MEWASIVLDGAIVESDSLIAAGSVVPPGAHIPSGKLAMGVPATDQKGSIRETEIDEIKEIC